MTALAAVAVAPAGRSFCVTRGLDSNLAKRRARRMQRTGLSGRTFVVSAQLSNVAPTTSSNERGGRKPLLDVIVPEAVHRRNAELVDQLRGKMILAPLTKGGNLPFRRLCAEFGADVTVSEMAFARHLIKGDRVERSRMYRAANEKVFGVQIATKTIAEGLKAANLAAEAGASFVDLNCGCPIHEVTRRGLGAVLPQKPAKLARLVKGIAAESPIPLTVKFRLGKDEKNINVQKVVEALGDSGAAALTIHGRTMQQRYRKPANWDKIGEVVSSGVSQIPIIGNGDILTHYEAQRRLANHGCVAVMAGRGALIKPWIFQEFSQGYEMNPDCLERIQIYRCLVAYMKEHFGDDERGRRKAWYFLPWHFSFLCRYRPFPEDLYGAKSLEYPLIGTRQDIVDPERGEDLDSLPLLERMLRCVDEELHEQIAAVLWDSASDSEAVTKLESLADEKLMYYEQRVAKVNSEDDRGDRRGRRDSDGEDTVGEEEEEEEHTQG